MWASIKVNTQAHQCPCQDQGDALQLYLQFCASISSVIVVVTNTYFMRVMIFKSISVKHQLYLIFCVSLHVTHNNKQAKLQDVNKPA